MLKKTLIAALVAAASTMPAFAQSTPKVAGTVTKVDESADKITLKHAPIPNLDMGEMTMAFRAADKAMLKAVKTKRRASAKS